jgi:hypothetical protein
VYVALSPRQIPIGVLFEFGQVEEAAIDRAEHSLNYVGLDEATLDQVIDQLVVVSSRRNAATHSCSLIKENKLQKENEKGLG